jgi:drug/metabolite transporter (DMT)-like permease
MAEATPVVLSAPADIPPAPIALRRPRLPLSSYDLLLLLMPLFWGSNFVVIKWAGMEVPNLVFSLVRFCIGTSAIGLVLLYSVRRAEGRLSLASLTLPRREWLVMIKLAFISTVLYQAFFLAGLRYTTAANSSLIVTSAPVIVVLLNALRGKDRIGRGGVIGAMLAFAGVSLVVLRSHTSGVQVGSQTLLGDLFSLGAALSWVWSVFASKVPIERIPGVVFSFWHAFGMVIMMAVMAFPDLLRTDWSKFDERMWLLILYSGIGPFCVAGMIWNASIKKIGPSRTAIYANLQPIVAAVAGAIFIGEPLTVVLAIGTVMVLTGVALVKRG